VPGVRDELRGVPGRPRPRPARLPGGRREVAREPGRLRVLRGRLRRRRRHGVRPGLGRLGLPAVQSGGRLRQDRDAAARSGQGPRGPAAGVADGARERGPGERVHGRVMAATHSTSLARSRARMSYVFVSGYTVLLLLFGLAPTLFAAYLSVTDEGAFVGVDNFLRVVQDFRFGPAVLHVALFVLFWLVGLIFFVVVLALLVHGLARRGVSTGLRFVYYVPGALAGASSVMLWLFVLDPTVSPVSWVLHALGNQTFVQTVSPGNLPVVFAIIAF